MAETREGAAPLLQKPAQLALVMAPVAVVQEERVQARPATGEQVSFLAASQSLQTGAGPGQAACAG